MNIEHDLQGRAYAKLSNLKAGDTVITDGSFTCLAEGVMCCVFGEGSERHLLCADGEHLLDGHLAEDGDTLIGFYPYGPTPAIAPEGSPSTEDDVL